jgi:hypothetical protein
VYVTNHSTTAGLLVMNIVSFVHPPDIVYCVLSIRVDPVQLIKTVQCANVWVFQNRYKKEIHTHHK